MKNNLIETHSAGGVVLNKHGYVLVVDQNGNSWSLPKGHVEKGETTRETAEREINEESGLKKLNYVKNLGEYKRYKISKDGGEDQSELKTITMFLYTTNERTIVPIDSNNQEARWVPREEVAELLTHKKDSEFFLSILETLD